jgi:hypothetical protein
LSDIEGAIDYLGGEGCSEVEDSTTAPQRLPPATGSANAYGIETENDADQDPSSNADHHLADNVHVVAGAVAKETAHQPVRDIADEGLFNGEKEHVANRDIVDGSCSLGELAAPHEAIDTNKDPSTPPSTPATEDPIWWQNEFLTIKKSKLGGLGAFAAKDLKYGQRILEELPIMSTNSWGICNEYDALSDEDKKLLHSLHKYSPNPNAHEIEKIRRANS